MSPFGRSLAAAASFLHRWSALPLHADLWPPRHREALCALYREGYARVTPSDALGHHLTLTRSGRGLIGVSTPHEPRETSRALGFLGYLAAGHLAARGYLRARRCAPRRYAWVLFRPDGKTALLLVGHRRLPEGYRDLLNVPSACLRTGEGVLHERAFVFVPGGRKPRGPTQLEVEPLMKEPALLAWLEHARQLTAPC